MICKVAVTFAAVATIPLAGALRKGKRHARQNATGVANDGCYQLRNPQDCCGSVDGRTGYYGGSQCVPLQSGACEPMKYISDSDGWADVSDACGSGCWQIADEYDCCSRAGEGQPLGHPCRYGDFPNGQKCMPGVWVEDNKHTDLIVPHCSDGIYETVADIDYYEGAAPANCVDAAFMGGHSMRGPANGNRCTLDIYRPGDATNAKVVIFIHAGGMQLGEKYTPPAMKKRGIVVVSINYRYSGMGTPVVKAPDYIHDAAKAFKWVYDNIATYGGDINNIYVVGESAGGWLSAMIALDTQYLGAHGLSSFSAVKGLGIMSGQMITHFQVRSENGNSDGLKPEINDMAPFYHQSGSQPKTFMGTAHRDGELFGRYHEMAFAHKLLQERGHTDNMLVEGPVGTVHADFGPSVYPALLEFFGL